MGFLSILIVAFFVLFVWLIPLRLWIAALASGVPINPFTFIAMRLRNIPPKYVVQALITARKAGLQIGLSDLERHLLAGGNIVNVLKGLISANRAGIPLTFARARAIDLAGRDVSEAVRTSVLPKVIDCPAADSDREWIDGVAGDGIQLKVKVRITVRTNLDTLVGGATEETIIARVGEGIVSGIGSAPSYKNVLEQPEVISRRVLAKGLDAGTAFEILSIDIADIEVGKNVGAELQLNQAMADKQIAQAKAEERRAMAYAREQTMKAKIEQMRAKVFEAQAEVPMAMAEAFRTDKIGLFDYYNLQNIMADTDMRKKLADTQNDAPAAAGA